MFKKILLASSIFAATTGIALANPAPYVGVGLGVTNNNAHVKIIGNDVPGGSFRGVPFNLFAGYGGVVSQSLYLAGEVFGTAATGTLSDPDKGSLKTTYGYGASIIPGIMLSDHTLAFARIGAIYSHFKNQDETRAGAQFGLGLQTSLTQNVDLRGEYDYVSYRDVTGNIDGDSYRISPRADQFTVSLVYKFE